MDTQILNKVDEIRKRFNVSHTDALEALKNNNGDVLKTIMFFEDKPSVLLNEFSQKAWDFIKDEPQIILSHKDKTVVKIPAIAGAAVMAVGLIKPKLIGLGVLGLIVSGSDLAYENKDKKISLRETIRKASQIFSKSYRSRKTNLEYRYSEMKESGFLKEFKEGGEKYFTVKL